MSTIRKLSARKDTPGACRGPRDPERIHAFSTKHFRSQRFVYSTEGAEAERPTGKICRS